MVPGVPCLDRGNWGRHCSLVTEFGVLRRKFWQVLRVIRDVRLAYKDVDLSERAGPRIIVLNASQVSLCSKRSREITTEPIAELTKIGS